MRMEQKGPNNASSLTENVATLTQSQSSLKILGENEERIKMILLSLVNLLETKIQCQIIISIFGST